MATTAPVIVSPSPNGHRRGELPEAVRRQMIAAHCAALCAWLNRIATEGEQREEGHIETTRTESEPGR